jgi:hypothetical protein
VLGSDGHGVTIDRRHGVTFIFARRELHHPVALPSANATIANASRRAQLHAGERRSSPPFER